MVHLVSKWFTGEGVVNLIAERLRSAQSIHQGSMCVAIAGYPAVGKTTISGKILSVTGPVQADYIGTESCILSREERQARRLSGCAVASYDIGKLKEKLVRLRTGRPVDIVNYSRKTGKHTGSTRWVDPAQKRMVVFDGAILLHPDLARAFAVSMFIQPYDLGEWLPFAARRDVAEYGYTEAEAIRQNEAKQEDIQALCSVSADIRLSCRIVERDDGTEIVYRQL